MFKNLFFWLTFFLPFFWWGLLFALYDQPYFILDLAAKVILISKSQFLLLIVLLFILQLTNLFLTFYANKLGIIEKSFRLVHNLVSFLAFIFYLK